MSVWIVELVLLVDYLRMGVICLVPCHNAKLSMCVPFLTVV